MINLSESINNYYQRLTEMANGNDSFEAAQAHFDSLQAEDQANKLLELEKIFRELGFDKQANIVQLIPDKDANMYFTLCKSNSGNEVEKYKDLVEGTLLSLGAKNIEFNQAIDYNGNTYLHGPFYLEGMTLK